MKSLLPILILYFASFNVSALDETTKHNDWKYKSGIASQATYAAEAEPLPPLLGSPISSFSLYCSREVGTADFIIWMRKLGFIRESESYTIQLSIDDQTVDIKVVAKGPHALVFNAYDVEYDGKPILETIRSGAMLDVLIVNEDETETANAHDNIRGASIPLDHALDKCFGGDEIGELAATG